MYSIKPSRISQFSNESQLFPASNLLKDSSICHWKCKNITDKEAFIELEYAGTVNIERIDIGNSDSAFIEIFIFDESDKNYRTLLFSTPLMTPADAIKNERGVKVRSFNKVDLVGNACSVKWKRLKVVCSQPFNKSVVYGLSFIKLFGSMSLDEILIEDSKMFHSTKIDVRLLTSSKVDEEWEPGSLFSHRGVNIPNAPIQTVPPRAVTQLTSATRETKESDIAREHHIDASTSTRKKLPNIKKCENSSSNTSGSRIRGNNELKSKNIGVTASCSSSVIPNDDEDHQNSSRRVLTSEKFKQSNIDNPETAIPLTEDTQRPSDKEKPIAEVGPRDNVLSGVSFVLSGFQNPLRNILRDSGIALGAKYRPSWTDNCTHLICAFPNTPKFKEVCGKGIMVSDKWILDCYEQKRHLPWRQYRLKGAQSPSKATNEASTSKMPFGDVGSPLPRKRARYCPVEECDTDDEIESAIKEMEGGPGDEFCLPSLPSMFLNMNFFFYKDFKYEERRHLRRLVVAFGGRVHEYMDVGVGIVVTWSSWDHTFDEALTDYPGLRFVSPAWIYECDRRRQLAPLATYEIRPQ